MERNIEDLSHLTACAFKQILKVSNNVSLCKLFLDKGIHRATLREKIILRFNQNDSSLFLCNFEFRHKKYPFLYLL